MGGKEEDGEGEREGEKGGGGGGKDSEKREETVGNPPRRGQTAGVKEERGCGNGEQERREEQVRSTDEYQEKKEKDKRDNGRTVNTEARPSQEPSVGFFVFSHHRW